MKRQYTATPGGNRLKALRELAGKTQLDVELDAELGSGYLQRVESGKVRHPEKETLERILNALGTRYTERRDVLEVFGYVVNTPLPDTNDLQWAMEACRADLQSAVFPAYLLDCTHRILTWNNLVPQLYRLAQFDDPREPRASMLKVIFDPIYGVAPRIANPDVFFPAQIRAMRHEMHPFHNEGWYSETLVDMRRIALFEYYWKRAEAEPAPPLAARPLTALELQTEDGLLQFRLLSETFAQDRRFRVIYCLPAEPKTIQWCLKDV